MLRSWSHRLAPLTLALVAACSGSIDRVVAPTPVRPSFASVPLTSSSGVVISQVYGGGGNGGATLRYDFIELYNNGADTVDLTGASLQYGSTTGTTWTAANKTDLSGKIAPGKFFLVQEASGANMMASPLPTPDLVGTIALGATAGKVALVNTTTLLTGTGCPMPSSVIDFVGFGTGTNCSEGNSPTPTLANTTAALRKPLAAGGFQDTNVNGADFTAGTPNPRNSGTTPTTPTTGPLATVTVGGGSRVVVGTPLQLTATAKDASANTIAGATFTWATSDPSRATVDATGKVTGVTAGGFVTITATTTVDGVTKSGAITLVVSQGSGAVTFSTRTVPLPVGFQTQLFAFDASNATITNATWVSSDPSVLTVDQRGVITAVGVGTASIAAFAPDGSAGATSVSTESQLFSSTARAGHNTEFGTPADADPSNDVLIARKQYTLSYNPQRGGPNWVSWDLSTTHLGSADRCNCFTADTALTRLGYTAYTTADYVGGGYDRGHMEPSADQTTTDTENGATFFLTNVLPQKHSLNAGPWEALEGALRDSARAGREVYQIAGSIFTGGVGLGSLSNQGKIFIPDSTWKIVILLPTGKGLGDVTATTDVDVIAVNMPNDSVAIVTKASPNDWTQYKTTVQKIQLSTGYDFLAALPEAIECKVEVRNCLAQATLAVTGTPTAGQPTSFNVAWEDADGTSDAPFRLVIDWGDGTSATGTYLTAYPTARPLVRQKTWSAPGTYVVKVTITDKRGGVSTTTQTVVVQ